MNWRKGAAALSVLLGALSLWLPWVPHRAAALVLTGLDLPDFVRFMGAAGVSLIRTTQVAFAVPLLALALSGILWAWTRLAASFWSRAGILVLGLWLASVAFSPLERRSEFLLAGGILAVTWLAAGFVRAPDWLAPVVAVTGGWGGAVAALAQFERLRPALAGLYGPYAWGAGPYLALAAAAVATALVAEVVWGRMIGPALSRRRSTRG